MQNSKIVKGIVIFLAGLILVSCFTNLGKTFLITPVDLADSQFKFYLPFGSELKAIRGNHPPIVIFYPSTSPQYLAISYYMMGSTVPRVNWDNAYVTPNSATPPQSLAYQENWIIVEGPTVVKTSTLPKVSTYKEKLPPKPTPTPTPEPESEPQPSEYQLTGLINQDINDKTVTVTGQLLFGGKPVPNFELMVYIDGGKLVKTDENGYYICTYEYLYEDGSSKRGVELDESFECYVQMKSNTLNDDPKTLRLNDKYKFSTPMPSGNRPPADDHDSLPNNPDMPPIDLPPAEGNPILTLRSNIQNIQVSIMVDGVWKSYYTPCNLKLPKGSYEVQADNTYFVKWSDGNVNPKRTISLQANTILTAVYDVPLIDEDINHDGTVDEKDWSGTILRTVLVDVPYLAGNSWISYVLLIGIVFGVGLYLKRRSITLKNPLTRNVGRPHKFW